MRKPVDAVAFLWRIIRARPPVVIAPLSGGVAALVVGVPVATVIDRTDGLGRLERLQARRSRLVYAPDRKTAVAIALRWRLNLSRIRIHAGGPPPENQVLGELVAMARKGSSWYAT